MRLLRTLLTVTILLVSATAEAGSITRPTKSFGGSSFINNVIPQASDFNGDADTIYSEFNGNIDNANIKSGAAIVGSKISPAFISDVSNTTAAPCFVWIENDQSADAQRWYECVSGGTWALTTNSDAGVVQNTWLSINRTNGGTTLGGASGTNTINGTTNFVGSNNLVPAGSITMWAGGSTAPTGWLLCDGTTYTTAAQSVLAVNLIPVASTWGLPTAVGTFTADNTTDILTLTSHGLANGRIVHLANSGGALPTGLTANTVYYVISATTNTFQISLTSGGSAIDFTTNGSGTNSAYASFKVPDARGRNALANGGIHALGDTGGAETHTLTAAESGLPDHTHGGGVSITNGSAGGGPNGFASPANTGGVVGGAMNAASAHSILDPFIVFTFIIKN